MILAHSDLHWSVFFRTREVKEVKLGSCWVGNIILWVMKELPYAWWWSFFSEFCNTPSFFTLFGGDTLCMCISRPELMQYIGRGFPMISTHWMWEKRPWCFFVVGVLLCPIVVQRDDDVDLIYFPFRMKVLDGHHIRWTYNLCALKRHAIDPCVDVWCFFFSFSRYISIYTARACRFLPFFSFRLRDGRHACWRVIFVPVLNNHTF